MRLRPVVLALASLVLVSPGHVSADFTSGSTGADGAFNPNADVTINLAEAGSGPGKGTYDPLRWAVIFNYMTIDIPAGVNVTFANHPSGAPVVWLATGNVTIAGHVWLDGAGGGYGATFAPPGPGGFEGGRRVIDWVSSPPTGGLGPGGGNPPDGHASYGTAGAGPTRGTYGNVAILPLIGGSGGCGGPGGGGAGAGALMIASSDTIDLKQGAVISANGGISAGYQSGNGSGGAIRLLADVIKGAGVLRALGVTGSGNGRIRVEAETPPDDLIDVGQPPWTFSLTPGPVFPDTSTAPTLAVTKVRTMPAPADPLAGITTVDVTFADDVAVEIHILARHIPPGTEVQVVLVSDGGSVTTLTSPPLAGDFNASTAIVSATFQPLKKTEIYLKANFGSGTVGVEDGREVTGRATWRQR